ARAEALADRLEVLRLEVMEMLADDLADEGVLLPGRARLEKQAFLQVARADTHRIERLQLGERGGGDAKGYARLVGHRDDRIALVTLDAEVPLLVQVPE